MAKLTSNDIKHTAELARIKLSANEVEKYTEELNSILEYIEILNDVKTDAVEETSQVTGLTNKQREDKVRPSLSQKQALSNSRHTEKGYFSIKK